MSGSRPRRNARRGEPACGGVLLGPLVRSVSNRTSGGARDDPGLSHGSETGTSVTVDPITAERVVASIAGRTGERAAERRGGRTTAGEPRRGAARQRVCAHCSGRQRHRQRATGGASRQLADVTLPVKTTDNELRLAHDTVSRAASAMGGRAQEDESQLVAEVTATSPAQPRCRRAARCSSSGSRDACTLLQLLAGPRIGAQLGLAGLFGVLGGSVVVQLDIGF